MLKLHGCNHVDDLSVLNDFPGLRYLSIADCDSISSLAPVKQQAGLLGLAVVRCLKVTDFTCVGECIQLHRIAIARHAESSLSLNDYREQLVDLYLLLPPAPTCRIHTDVPEEQIIMVLDEIPQFIEDVGRELAEA